MSLLLFARPLQSTTALQYSQEIGQLARRWRRSIRAIGGYWIGSFEISQEDLTSEELNEMFNTWIGCRLEEVIAEKVSWEGYIVEMRRMADGQEQSISLDLDVFHPRVNVKYSNNVGERAETGWSENTDASAIFGEAGLLISLGGATATGATALRDRHLKEYAWPRARIVGGDARSFDRSMRPDVLKVKAVGYWNTLNWRYTESSASNARADTLISNLVGTSEFVSAGRLEENDFAPNTLEYDAYPIPMRTGDIIRSIIEQGDTSADVWQGGVYAGREFIYEEAPTDWTYQMSGEILANKAGMPVDLQSVEPGFLLFNPKAPTGWKRPGTTSDWDDPQINYVDEVEFVSGVDSDTLRMHMRDAREEVSVLARAVRAGVIGRYGAGGMGRWTRRTET